MNLLPRPAPPSPIVVATALPIARELSAVGICVATIAPGIMETPMLLGLPQDVQTSLGKSVPFPPRLGRPGEFAELVRHSAQNAYLNGVGTQPMFAALHHARFITLLLHEIVTL